MRKIFYKYFYLNRKNSLLGLLSACFFGLIAFDSNKYYAVALLMVPSLLFSFVVGKMCYEEDSKSTKEFLLSLPIVKSHLASEKNIVGQICILAGLVIVNLMFFIVNVILKKTDIFFSVETMLTVTCFLITYNTVYILLNYKFDYSKTQLSSYIIVVFMLILFKFGDGFMGWIGNLNTFVLIALVAAISVSSLIITKKNKWNL